MSIADKRRIAIVAILCTVFINLAAVAAFVYLAISFHKWPIALLALLFWESIPDPEDLT